MSGYNFNKNATDGDKVTLQNGVQYTYESAKDRWVVSSVEGSLGEELVKKSGDTMTGTLEMVKTDGVDPVIETRYLSSGENSNLHLQHDGNTRVYVGGNEVSFAKPIQLNQEGVNPDHAVTKKYVDDADAHLQVKIDELEQEIDVIAPRLDAAQYTYTDSPAVKPGEMHIVSGTFTGASDVILFNDEALDGNVHTWAAVDVGEYIEITDTNEKTRTADNYAMYLVTKAPEGTGMKQIEVSIVKGQGVPVVGDVVDVKAFQLGSNEINDLDGRYLLNGGSTTLTGHTQILSTGSKYINIQAAPNETKGFFVMRDNNSRNIMHVSNNGEIKLKEGRMATDLDEITTKRYVDSKLSSGGGGGGSSVIGRRFKYNTSGDYSTKGYFCYGSGKLKLATEDMDGGKMIHSSNNSVNGVNEITWGSNLKFTIRDSSGYMVVMGEASGNTDYASNGLRLRVPDSMQSNGTGPRFGHFTKLQGGKYYQITVEGYF